MTVAFGVHGYLTILGQAVLECLASIG